MNWINNFWSETILPGLKGAVKSWTVWFSVLMGALPDLLAMLQNNFSDIAPYIPEVKQPQLLHAIAVAILLLRIRTTVSLSAKGK